METAGILAKEFHLKAEHIQSIIILIDDGIAFYASDTAKGAVFHENYHQIAQRMSIIMINKEERSIQI